MRYLSGLETVLFRGTVAVLIFVIYVGSVCPPLYEGVLPHDHLFVGGPPPADWESHHHDNPLAALLGGADSSAAVAPVSEPAILGAIEIKRGQTGKVVSLYAAPSALILSVFTLAATIPATLLFCSLVIRWTVGVSVASLSSAEPAAPRPPPPRLVVRVKSVTALA